MNYVMSLVGLLMRKFGFRQKLDTATTEDPVVSKHTVAMWRPFIHFYSALSKLVDKGSFMRVKVLVISGRSSSSRISASIAAV